MVQRICQNRFSPLGDGEVLDYIAFHLQTIGCPYCQANLDDLKRARSPGRATRK